MKITAEADFFINRYGLEAGLQKLAEQGYRYISYNVRVMHEDASFGEWPREKLEAYCQPLRQALEKSGLQLAYLIADRGIYSHADPGSFPTRKSWCVQTVRMAAYLGCPAAVIRPASVPASCDGGYERSQELLEQALSAMAAEGARLGVRPAILNTSELFVYGNRTQELLALAQEYRAGILLDPSAAYQLRQRIPCLTTVGYWDSPSPVYPENGDEPGMPEVLREHLIGVVCNDTERTIGNPMLPLMGALDYRGIRRQLGESARQLYLTMAYQPIFKRYDDFLDRESLVAALTEYFYHLAKGIGEKEVG